VDGDVHTGQVFFPESITRAVYRTKHYAAHGPADTTNSEDMIYGDGGSRTTLKLRRRSGGGYLGKLTLGVQ
jgi:hypothetical protein